MCYGINFCLLFSSKPSLMHSPLPHDFFQALTRLRSFLGSQDFLADQAGYSQAVSALDLSASHIAHAGVNIEAGAILLWPFFLPDSIVAHIKGLRPHALLVLSYYAVLLSALERSYWWLRGWGSELLDDITSHLHDQPSLQDMLAWPKSCIRA